MFVQEQHVYKTYRAFIRNAAKYKLSGELKSLHCVKDHGWHKLEEGDIGNVK